MTVVYVKTEKKRTATPGRNVKTTHEQTRQNATNDRFLLGIELQFESIFKNRSKTSNFEIFEKMPKVGYLYHEIKIINNPKFGFVAERS
jgi:hypothetical protein